MGKLFKTIIILLILNFFLQNKTIKLNTQKIYNTSNRNITINNYYMLLEIPIIDLKKEIYNISNINNDINKNVFLLYEDYTTILVSHSGSNYNAYFKNLYKLNIGDEVIIYKEENKTNYKVQKIFYQNKKEAFKLQKEYENKLILITCLNKEKYLIIECQRQNN